MSRAAGLQSEHLIGSKLAHECWSSSPFECRLATYISAAWTQQTPPSFYSVMKLPVSRHHRRPAKASPPSWAQAPVRAQRRVTRRPSPTADQSMRQPMSSELPCTSLNDAWHSASDSGLGSSRKTRRTAYRSSSSSSPGRGIAAASSISLRYCSSSFSSTCAVGGARAGAATNSFANVSVGTQRERQGCLPETGCRRASAQATGTVSRSYNLTSQKCRSTASFSCGGR